MKNSNNYETNKRNRSNDNVEKSVKKRKFSKYEPQRKNIEYSFNLDQGISKKIKEREKDLNKLRKKGSEKNSDLSNEKERLSHANFLYFVLNKKDVAEKDENYPTGEGNGRIYRFEHNGSKFQVRLDMKETRKEEAGKTVTTRKFYPRVSIQGEDSTGKTTQDFANLLDDEPPAYKKYFLMALQGNEFQYDNNDSDDIEKDAAETAFEAGLEARVTVLISDAIHFPGNSIITEHLLSKADENNYKALFLGNNLEGSYGAIPNQNQKTVNENDFSKTKAYNGIGKFLSNGELKTTAVKSNLHVLRKINSLTNVSPNLATIRKNGKMVDSETYNQQINSLKTLDKHEYLKNKLEDYDVVSHEEIDETDELTKYNWFSIDQLDERDEYLKNMEELIKRKREHIQKLRAEKIESLKKDTWEDFERRIVELKRSYAREIGADGVNNSIQEAKKLLNDTPNISAIELRASFKEIMQKKEKAIRKQKRRENRKQPREVETGISTFNKTLCVDLTEHRNNDKHKNSDKNGDKSKNNHITEQDNTKNIIDNTEPNPVGDESEKRKSLNTSQSTQEKQIEQNKDNSNTKQQPVYEIDRRFLNFLMQPWAKKGEIGQENRKQQNNSPTPPSPFKY